MGSNQQIKVTDLKALLPVIRKRKWLVLVPWILTSAIVFGGSYFLTPTYEASTIISIDTEVKLSQELQNLLGMRQSYRAPARRDQLRSIYNEITSSKYITLLNQKLSLDDDPLLVERARQMAATMPLMTEEQLVVHLLQNSLQGLITVTSAASDQIQLNVESTDPVKARDIANTLGEVFISERHIQEMASIRSSQNFSDIQLQKYENLLNTKIRERTEFEKNYITVQLDESITSESNRTEITAEVDRTANEISDLRGDEREILANLVRDSEMSSNNLSLSDSDENRQQKTELKQNLRSIGNLMIRYTWSDPQILNFKVRQNTTLSSIESENRTLVNRQYSAQPENIRGMLVRLFNTRSNLEYLYAKASYLESALDELTAKMNLIPEYQAELSRLEQEIETTRELRDRFKRQQESSSISQALLQDMSSSKFKVVEPARTPLAPFKPDRIRIVLMGVILGLVIGAGAAIAVELMDSSYKSVDDVQDNLGLPVLGITPRMQFLKKVSR